MIRTLSLAAALAVLPLSTALASEQPAGKASAEAAIEAAAAAFEKRMESFGERAEAIAETPGLSEGERETRIANLWAEYQPEIATFTASITAQAGQIAQSALAAIDVEALVSDALNDPEVQSALEAGMTTGQGVVANSAWTNLDPEQVRTYGLIAQYALDQAADAVEDADAAADADVQARIDEAAAVRDAAAAPRAR